MGNIARNCAGRRLPFRRTSKPTTFPKSERYFAWMANKAQGRSSPIWATSRMSPVGKTTPSSIAGVVTRPGDRKPGRSSASGSGTSDSNWGIGLCQIRCARPSLPLLFHHNRNQLSPVRARLLSKLPPRGTLHLPPRGPGRLAASPAPTFPSNRMEPCDIPQAACCSIP